MNREQKIELKRKLTEFVDYYKKDKKFWEDYCDLCGGDNNLIISHYELMSKYIHLFSCTINDNYEWLDYYLHACVMGNNPMTVEIDGVKRKMKNIDTLIWAMTTDVKEKE